jgi:hypothetical integral membrane protein (TIGR02206 family)
VDRQFPPYGLSHWLVLLTFAVGARLVLSSQALVSPAHTGPDFPHYGFLAFWAIHLLVVWAAIYLTWGLGMRPSWRSYRITVTVTVVWALFTFAFNSIAGTNYGFLNAKPATPSLLDVLGPLAVVPGAGHRARFRRVGIDDLAVGSLRPTS